MTERENFLPIKAGEFLGAGKRFEPISSEGEAVLRRNGVWKQPPFLHEQTVVSAWVRSVEEMALGRIFNQHLRDITTLFSWISSGRAEPMVIEDFEKRKVRPPFLSEEGRELMFLQIVELRGLRFSEGRDRDQMIKKILEEDLEVLRQADIFRLSKIELRTVEENIKEELQRRVV